MRFSRKSTGHSLSPRRPACPSGPRGCLPGSPDAAAVPSHSGHHDIQSRQTMITTLNNIHVNTEHLGSPWLSRLWPRQRQKGPGEGRGQAHSLRRGLALSQWAALPGRLDGTERSTHVTTKCGGDAGGVGRRDGGQEMWSSSWRRPVVPCA